MAIIYDMLELDGLPGNGDTVGVPGSGSDIEFLLTETQAEVPDDYFSAALSEVIEGGFHLGSNGTWPAEIDSITYSTSGLWDITFDLGGTTQTGFIVQAEPVGGGALRYFFLPEDGIDPLDINQITIQSMTSTVFIDADWVDVDESVNFLVCFVAGTELATARGSVPVEELVAGDRVSTLDHGEVPILRTAETRVSQADAVEDARLRAIEIAPGAFADNLPERSLRVSRQHRMLVRSRIAERMLGHVEVLVAAKDLLDLPGVTQTAPTEDLRYVHLLLPCHSVLLAEGIGAESLWLGEEAGLMLGADVTAQMRRQLFADQQPARPFVHGRRAHRLVARHIRNERDLCEPGRRAAIAA